VALAIRAYLAVIFNLIILRRQVGVDPRKLLTAVLPPYVAALAMSAVVLAIGHLLTPGWPDWAKLAVMILGGALTYPLVLWLVWRNYVQLALTEIGEMFPRLEKLLRRFTPQPSAQ